MVRLGVFLQPKILARPRPDGTARHFCRVTSQKMKEDIRSYCPGNSGWVRGKNRFPWETSQVNGPRNYTKTMWREFFVIFAIWDIFGWCLFASRCLARLMAPTFTRRPNDVPKTHCWWGNSSWKFKQQLGLSPSHDVGTVDVQVEIEGSQRITGEKGRREQAEQLFGIWKLEPTNHHHQHQISREVVATQIFFWNVHPDLGKIRFPFWRSYFSKGVGEKPPTNVSYNP